MQWWRQLIHKHTHTYIHTYIHIHTHIYIYNLNNTFIWLNTVEKVFRMDVMWKSVWSKNRFSLNIVVFAFAFVFFPFFFRRKQKKKKTKKKKKENEKRNTKSWLKFQFTKWIVKTKTVRPTGKQTFWLPITFTAWLTSWLPNRLTAWLTVYKLLR